MGARSTPPRSRSTASHRDFTSSSSESGKGTSDEQLVQQTLAGRLAGYEQLVERHQKIAYRVAARIVGEADAEDVTQDAFLQAFNTLDRFRGEAPFRMWLLRIIHNTALNSVARRRPAPVPDPSETPGASRDSVTTDKTPAHVLEERERRERLIEKLALLPARHRSVLVLRDLEGLSYEGIAQITGSPIGSVKGRLHRARKQLAEILEQNTYDWEIPR